MNGITIIEEHLCRAVELPELIAMGIFITLLFVGILLFFIFIDLRDKTNKNHTDTIIASILLVVVYIVLLAIQINNYNDTHIEYTVTIDDSVSFNDFHTKYEIVSVSGDKYRVVEK